MKPITLEALQNMMGEDSNIDITKLDTDSVKAPYLYSKYINIHATEKRILKMLYQHLIRDKRIKTEYYRGNASEEEYKEKPLHMTILKSQVQSYVDSDEDIQELQAKIDTQDIKVDMLTEYLKSLFQRTFHIKNAIEFLKFKNGLM
jgi:hypothetical protein